MPETRRCTANRRDGSPCRGAALAGGSFCRFHEPELAEQRQAERSAGGRAARRGPVALPPETPDLPLETAADLKTALALTFNQVRRGQVDTKIGNCLAVLASTALRAIEGDDHERRLAELERLVKQKREVRGEQSERPHNPA